MKAYHRGSQRTKERNLIVLLTWTAALLDSSPDRRSEVSILMHFKLKKSSRSRKVNILSSSSAGNFEKFAAMSAMSAMFVLLQGE